MPPPIGRKTASIDFEEAANPPDIQIRPTRKRKRPSPVSVRLDDNEKAELKAKASGMPLGTYIKACLFGGRSTYARRHAVDREALAQALGKLGQSRLASNLNQIAKAANLGTLPVTPDLTKELNEACQEVRTLRRTLIAALGLKDLS